MKTILVAIAVVHSFYYDSTINAVVQRYTFEDLATHRYKVSNCEVDSTFKLKNDTAYLEPVLFYEMKDTL